MNEQTKEIEVEQDLVLDQVYSSKYDFSKDGLIIPKYAPVKIVNFKTSSIPASATERKEYKTVEFQINYRTHSPLVFSMEESEFKSNFRVSHVSERDMKIKSLISAKDCKDQTIQIGSTVFLPDWEDPGNRVSGKVVAILRHYYHYDAIPDIVIEVKQENRIGYSVYAAMFLEKDMTQFG